MVVHTLLPLDLRMKVHQQTRFSQAPHSPPTLLSRRHSVAAFNLGVRQESALRRRSSTGTAWRGSDCTPSCAPAHDKAISAHVADQLQQLDGSLQTLRLKINTLREGPGKAVLSDALQLMEEQRLTLLRSQEQHRV
eukprot:TRINITY_DN21139_c0_g1_i1.p1 TRINITY_DN21139_c0_g1~~TRINITY_DN21139_c0_g1_i1.p1  ORF type:complete len:136 (+),score=29.23 TRINITY_DN21139_c0_g1_i1:232-639(+)